MGQSLRPTWIVRGFSCSSLFQLYVPVQHRTQGQRRSLSENEPNFGSNCEHSAVRRGGYWNTVLIHCPPRQVKSPSILAPRSSLPCFFAATTDRTQPPT